MPRSDPRTHHSRDDSGQEDSSDSSGIASKSRRYCGRRDSSTDHRRTTSVERDRSESAQRRVSRSRSRHSIQKNGRRTRLISPDRSRRYRRGSPKDTRREYTSRRASSPGRRPSPRLSRHHAGQRRSSDISPSPTETRYVGDSSRHHYSRPRSRDCSRSITGAKQRRGYYGSGKGSGHVSPARRRGYYRGPSPPPRARLDSGSPRREHRREEPLHRRHRQRSGSARSASKRRPRTELKSPSPRPERAVKRTWKFDSPPREDGVGGGRTDGFGAGTGLVASSASGPLNVNGVPGTISQLLLGDGPQQQSPMGLLAQSLGLSAEQQKASRELYIGNLPPALDVNQLIEFFNAAMLTLKASSLPGNPVSRAWIASDGHFAFVEFRTIEEATIGLQLNGLNCMGYA